MAPGERREAPVSFRPGKLRGALEQRVEGTRAAAALGQVAKRDLARYYLLLGSVSLDERLTRREAIWLTKAHFDREVADGLSGDPFIPEHMDPSDELLRIVDLAIRNYWLRNHKPPEIPLRVQQKIQAMTALERAALIDALNRLPFSHEEEAVDPANWALIGIRLADEPVLERAQAETEKGGADD